MVSAQTFSVMYDHALSFPSKDQIRPQATSKASCKPGGCRWPLYLPHVFA